eukprot:2969830-Prymnesium_polylepis.1
MASLSVSGQSMLSISSGRQSFCRGATQPVSKRPSSGCARQRPSGVAPARSRPVRSARASRSRHVSGSWLVPAATCSGDTSQCARSVGEPYSSSKRAHSTLPHRHAQSSMLSPSSSSVASRSAGSPPVSAPDSAASSAAVSFLMMALNAAAVACEKTSRCGEPPPCSPPCGKSRLQPSASGACSKGGGDTPSK